MDLEEQFGLEHLLFRERRCRVCGRDKDLMNDFYLIRPAVLLSKKKNYLNSLIGEKGKKLKENFLYTSKNVSTLTDKDIRYFLQVSE